MWAEKELASEVARSQTWRQRAEDRTARIQLLEERIAESKARPNPGVFRSLVSAGRNMLRGKKTVATPKAPATAPAPDQGPDEQPAPADHRSLRDRPPSYPTILVAALGKPALPFLEEFDSINLETDLDAMYVADFVFATTSALSACPAAAAAALAEWVRTAGRQSLVVWCDEPASASAIVDGADLLLSDDPGASELDMTIFSPGVERIGRTDGMEPNGGEPNIRSVVAARQAYRTEAPQVRAAHLLQLLGIAVSNCTPEVGALLVTNKPDFVLNGVESILAQRNVEVMVVVVLHGDQEMFGGVRDSLDRMLSGKRSVVIELDAASTLGEGLNQAAAACSSPVLAKFDDDDWYGPHYLEDALIALDCSQADMVGKARYFVEIEHEGDVFLVNGPEESFSDHLIGSSLVFRRSLWEKVPFPHRPSRVDSIFLRGVRAVGAKIYSNSRFEHGVRRRAAGHTWQVDAAHFAARGTRVGSSFLDVQIDAEEPAS